MKRLKIFSNTRRKIFSSDNEGGMTLRKVVCQDCGQELETSASSSRLICPRCGGKRFNVVEPSVDHKESKESHEKHFSIFSDDSYNRTFMNPTNNLEKKLKTYSGKTLGKDEFEKTFSDSADDLLEKGFAIADGDRVKISDSAYATEKMFSKIIISVTKILDLDPSVTEENKEEIIDGLHDRIPEKGIIILKKAHGLEPKLFCDKCADSDAEQWIEDSRIIPDLKLEYGNKSFGIKQFMDILQDRYKDAPDNIIDLLTSKNVIRIEGNQVTISN